MPTVPLPRARRRGGCAVLAVLLFAAAPAAGRILVVGDSNALGVGVRPQLAWTSRLQQAVDEIVQVYGAPGMSVASPAFGAGWHPRCLFADTGLTPPRAAVFALGTNDTASQPADVRTATRAILAAVSAPWICVTPPRIRDDDARLEPIRAAIAAACSAAGATIIDGAALIGAADLHDGTHFAPRGHAELARAIAAALGAGPR